MKNTMYTEKCLIQLISLSQKGCFILYNENKIAFCFKKGRFIGPKNLAFSVEKGVFFSPRIREKGVFFKLGYERGIRFGREWGWGWGWGCGGCGVGVGVCVCVCGGGGGGGGRYNI